MGAQRIAPECFRPSARPMVPMGVRTNAVVLKLLRDRFDGSSIRDLHADPLVRVREAVAQGQRGTPVQALVYEAVIGIAAAHAARTGYMAHGQLFVRDIHHGFRKLVDANHLFRPDVHWTCKIGFYEPAYAFEALIDVEE